MFEQNVVSTANLLKLDSGIWIIMILVRMSSQSKLDIMDQKGMRAMGCIGLPVCTMFLLLRGRHPVDYW